MKLRILGRKGITDNRRCQSRAVKGIESRRTDMRRMMGTPGAVVLEPDSAKREAALAAGAIAAIDPRDRDAVEQVRAALGQPVLFVLDLVGSGESASMGFELLDRSGKLVVVGLLGGAMQLAVPMLPTRAATLQGSYIGRHDEFRELVALVRDRGGLATPVDRRSLSEADSALQDLRAGRVLGRVVLVP